MKQIGKRLLIGVRNNNEKSPHKLKKVSAKTFESDSAQLLLPALAFISNAPTIVIISAFTILTKYYTFY